MKILKIVLIVILALGLAASGGLFVYSALHPQTPQDSGTKTAGGAPSMDLFLGDDVTHYDIAEVVSNPATVTATEATDLLLKAAYNLINIKQYYYFARVDVNIGTNNFFSDYNYTKNGLNTFKRAQAYAGSKLMTTFVVRTYYVDHRLDFSGLATYDFDNEIWSYGLGEPTKNQSATLTKDDETPYYLYGSLDFPVDFGGVKAAEFKEGRSEAIDYTLIDPESIEMTDSGKGYYTLKFDILPAKLNASPETKYRLSDTNTAERMKYDDSLQFYDFTVTAEIWKESGVFRSLSYTTNINASIGSDSGDCYIEKTMNFSYDDKNCSVAYKIKNASAEDPLAIYKYLPADNQARCDAELTELEAKLAAAATAGDADSDEDAEADED